jgi:hypothetical protein
MTGQIQVEDLVKELEEGSGYKHIDDEKCNYYHYESVKFIFGEDKVTIQRKHGYDGEEDMASEWFNAGWECVVPRQVIDETLSKLVGEGNATLADVDITETYSGRKAYGVVEGNRSRSYKTNLELILRTGSKPVIRLGNPQEMHDAGSL